MGQTNNPKLKVAFDCSCRDAIGSQIATKFRDSLATSPRYVEVPVSAKSADGDGYDWKVLVVSEEDDVDGQHEVSSAMSIVVTWKGAFVTHFVNVCGGSKIDACEAQLFSNLDSAIHDFYE
jgi:hypothetical protein